MRQTIRIRKFSIENHFYTYQVSTHLSNIRNQCRERNSSHILFWSDHMTKQSPSRIIISPCLYCISRYTTLTGTSINRSVSPTIAITRTYTNSGINILFPIPIAIVVCTIRISWIYIKTHCISIRLTCLRI